MKHVLAFLLLASTAWAQAPAVLVPIANGSKAYRFNDPAAGFSNTGFKVFDNANDHYTTWSIGENLTGNRVITVNIGDTARSLTLSGNPTIADWFNQDVKSGTSPTFVLTNCTGLPIAGITSSTSAELRTLLSDESGTGAAIFGTSPTMTNATINQAADGNTALTSTRFTDSTPTGALYHMKTAAGGTLAHWGANGFLSFNRASGSTYLLDTYVPTGAVRLNVETGDASNASFRMCNTGRDYQFTSIGSNGHWTIVDNTAALTRFRLDTAGNISCGNATANASATGNFVLGAGSTSGVMGAATADMVHFGSIDRVNTRHAAAGNRTAGVQGERGSAIYIGDDAIDFAATTGYITVNATDLAITSTTVAMPQKISTYNNIATVTNGVPSLLAQVNTTGLTANVSATTLYAVPASGAGMYRVNAYLVETTAGSVSSVMPSLTITFTDTDTNGAVTLTATQQFNNNVVGTAATGVVVLNAKASTNIQYATTGYASNAAGMAYAIHLRLEAL